MTSIVKFFKQEGLPSSSDSLAMTIIKKEEPWLNFEIILA
jgi:hypothetical protein